MIREVSVEDLLASSGLHADPRALWILSVLHEAELELTHDPARAGCDLKAIGELETGPNRARVKLWAPKAGTLAAFLYKDSLVPFSTDRFAYGALILKDPNASEQRVRPLGKELVEFLGTGLHPLHRPRDLKRAFPFTVPR